MKQKQLDQIIFKTQLGRISLRQCRKAYQLVFRREMPGNLAYAKALGLAIDKAGDRKVVNIIRAIDRIDGDPAFMAGWGK